MAKKTKKKNKATSKSNEHAAPKRAKPKQLAIAGTERKVHPDIEKAAEAYVDARDKRMQLTEQEHETQETLMSAMKKHGLQRHVVDVGGEQQIVEIVATDEKVRVRRYDPDKEAKRKARKNEREQTAGATA